MLKDKSFIFSEQSIYVVGATSFPVTTLRLGGGTASTIDFTIKDFKYGTGGFFQVPTLSCELQIGFSSEKANCIYCPDTYIRNVFNKNCTTEASCDGYYDSDTLSCRKCHGSCSECSGPKETDCTKCAGAYPYLFTGRCFIKCPFGSYENDLTNTCDCHETCSTCSYNGQDRSTCSACVSTTIGYIVGHECIEGVVCSPGTFSQLTTQSCVSSCSGKLGNVQTRECVDYCPEGTVKYQTSYCYIDCPANYFKERVETDPANPLETKFYCK